MLEVNNGTVVCTSKERTFQSYGEEFYGKINFLSSSLGKLLSRFLFIGKRSF